MNNFFLDHANMVDFVKTIDWDNITTSSDETTIKVRTAIMDVAEIPLEEVSEFLQTLDRWQIDILTEAVAMKLCRSL
jgi:hypothetical protein